MDKKKIQQTKKCMKTKALPSEIFLQALSMSCTALAVKHYSILSMSCTALAVKHYLILNQTPYKAGALQTLPVLIVPMRPCVLTVLFGLVGGSAVQGQGLKHLKVRLFHQHFVVLGAHTIGGQGLHTNNPSEAQSNHTTPPYPADSNKDKCSNLLTSLFVFTLLVIEPKLC